jgi:hypothetical protein
LALERRRQVFHGFSPGDIEQFISYLSQVENNILDHKHHKGVAPASSDVSP